VGSWRLEIIARPCGHAWKHRGEFAKGFRGTRLCETVVDAARDAGVAIYLPKRG
jgi:hypothetical protein